MRRWVGFFRGLGLAGCFLGGLIASSVGTVVLTATPVFAQTASSIVVEGNRRVEAATIRSYFRTAPGERLSEAKINAALKALYATNLFLDVRVRHSGERLVVTVVENPVINQVAFEGNKKVKDEQLKTEVQSKPRGTFSRPTVQADVQRMVEIYRRMGRYDVTVVPKVIDLPNNRVNLVFEIHEGPKIGVAEIDFVGNHAYSDYRLKSVIKTSVSNWLSFLQTTDVYDPDRVEADRDLLRRFYLKHGYADVRVVSAVAQYDPRRKGFIVTFTIDEGALYHIGKVDVQSNVQSVNASSLRSILRTQPGDVYNAEAVEKTVEDLAIEVSKRGYAFANIHPRGDRDYRTHIVNLVYVVDEGPRVYIERINIRGNTRTRDYVIRREFDIGEGDPYNRALVDRAERRLKNLNFFKSVKITNERGSAPDRIVLNVDVVEQPTGEFSISGGYSSTGGWMAQVSVGERNLLGEGKSARVSVTYGQYSKGFDLSYAEPYLFGYRMTGAVDLFAKQNIATSFVGYDTKTIGGNLRLGFALTEEVSLQLRYSLYRQEIGLPTTGTASLPVLVELAQGPTLTSSVGYTVNYNTLDDNRSPTQGINASLNQDFAGVGGDVNFIRSSVDVRDYHEVLSDLVGVLHLQAGTLTGWGSKKLRMLDQFQLGPSLVRGFAPSGIGPRDVATGDALGGQYFWGSSVEFQYPLFFLPKEIGVKASVYADAGSLWSYGGPTTFTTTSQTLTVQDGSVVRSSIGAGLIWNSPFGPLRIDYAFPISKANYDRTQEISFGGGTSF
jgi:outer membrane protein insertion porin family